MSIELALYQVGHWFCENPKCPMHLLMNGHLTQIVVQTQWSGLPGVTGQFSVKNMPKRYIVRRSMDGSITSGTFCEGCAWVLWTLQGTAAVDMEQAE